MGVVSMFLKMMVVAVPAMIAYMVHQRTSYVGPNGYGFRTTADEVAAGIDLTGKTAVVTGATSGLGWETARVLAQQGANVFVGGRTTEKAEQAAERIEEHIIRNGGIVKGHVQGIACGVSTIEEAMNCAGTIRLNSEMFDLLFLNAGVAWLPEHEMTEDGFEATMAINHLNQFRLATLLLPWILSSAEPRIVFTSSAAAQFSSREVMMDPRLGMDDWDTEKRSWLAGSLAYGDSKLANVMMAAAMNNKFAHRAKPLLTYSVHPGEIMTGIIKPDQGWLPYLISLVAPLVESLIMKTPAQGAATQVYAALRAAPKQSGKYFENCNVATMPTEDLSDLVKDVRALRDFYDNTNTLVSDAFTKVEERMIQERQVAEDRVNEVKEGYEEQVRRRAEEEAQAAAQGGIPISALF